MEKIDPEIGKKILDRYNTVLADKKHINGHVGGRSVSFYMDMQLTNIIPSEYWNNGYSLKEPYWSYVRTLQFKMRKELGEKIKRNKPKEAVKNTDTSKPFGRYNAGIAKIVR